MNDVIIQFARLWGNIETEKEELPDLNSEELTEILTDWAAEYSASGIEGTYEFFTKKVEDFLKNGFVSIWTVAEAEGGYRSVGARAFASYDEAYEYMRGEYEYSIEQMEDHSECWIEKDCAEVYCSDMSCDEPWTARIEEHKVRLPRKQAPEKKRFGVALLEKPHDSGLNKEETIRLLDLLYGDQAFPIDIEGEYSAAMGWINRTEADHLDYDFKGLQAFVKEILDDMETENPDHEYLYTDKETGNEVEIFLSRNIEKYDEDALLQGNSGYITIAEYHAPDGESIDAYMDVTLCRDDSDHHSYFGIYHCADSDSGNICEPDWEYTKDCSLQSLKEAMQTVSDMYTYEKVMAMYSNYMEKRAATDTAQD